MDYKYRPYLISAEFDTLPDQFSNGRWVIGISVELGDSNGPRYKDNRSKFAKWFDSSILNGETSNDEKSLNVFFTFFICSQQFRKDPPEIYKKYAKIMLVQDTYKPLEAEKYLRHKIDSIGEVTEKVLTDKLHQFLETEEWDFDGA